MALTYSSSVQTRIASLLGLTYATTSAANKTLIDGTSSSNPPAGGMALDAYTEISQIGQWFSQVAPASTSTAPAVWEPWLVALTALKVAKNIHPEREAIFQKLHDEAKMAALDAYSANAIDYDPGLTPNATVLTVQNIRFYTMLLCARRERWHTVEGTPALRPRLWVQPEIVDANIERVIRNIWNRGEWPFTRRMVTMKITPYNVTGCTYAHSSKTITSAAAFSTAIPAGSRCVVRSGTGANTGDYVITSATANSVTLSETIGAAADTQTDISVTVWRVDFVGLGSDLFRSFASRELYYDDSNAAGGIPLKWARDGTEMAKMRAWSAGTTDTRRPTHFRFNTNPSVATSLVTGYTFDFYPPPDTTYSARGEAFVQGPALTSLAATTTALLRFPPEFNHVIKDMILAETLDHYGDPSGAVLRERMETEITRLLPVYADVGNQDNEQEVRDVYNDTFDMTRIWGGTFGGGL